MVPPSEFIPIAERTGFISELGDWVLRQACIEAVRWRNPLKIAVNVGPRQLANSALPSRVREILDETGLDAAVWSWRSPNPVSSTISSMRYRSFAS